MGRTKITKNLLPVYDYVIGECHSVFLCFSLPHFNICVWIHNALSDLSMHNILRICPDVWGF